MNLLDYLIPIIIFFILLLSIIKRKDTFDIFTEGVFNGLITIKEIFPSFIILMTGIGILKSSGFIDILTDLFIPITEFFGFPKECTQLIFIRPFSGSGALSVYDKIISEYGPDDLIGKIASTMMGSSETTFYTVAVYFGAAKIKKTKYMIPAALAADLTGWIFSTIIIKLFFNL